MTTKKDNERTRWIALTVLLLAVIFYLGSVIYRDKISLSVNPPASRPGQITEP